MSYTIAMEERYKYNAITRYFHTFRLKNTLHYVKKLSEELGRPPVVMDIGCGPGGVYFFLKEHCDIRYIGVENCEIKAAKGNEAFANEPNAKILCQDASKTEVMDEVQPDLIMALESFEHIPPGVVVRIIETVRSYNNCKNFICSVPVEVGPAIWIKNIGSALMRYKRHKEYSWSETFWAGVYRLDKLPRHTLHHKGFDWRWLAHNLRMNFIIDKIHTSPYDFVPAALSPSIMFVCSPDPALRSEETSTEATAS